MEKVISLIRFFFNLETGIRCNDLKQSIIFGMKMQHNKEVLVNNYGKIFIFSSISQTKIISCF